MQKVGKAIPFLFEEYLILALHPDWIKVFNNKIPTFVIHLDDDGHLCIISKESIVK